MTDKQWAILKDVVNGKNTDKKTAGFIIDCPWLPGWYGVSVLDYFTSDEIWLKANLKAIETFPDVIFLPGFWSEYGMCTEPSAFGAKCVFWKEEFPFANKVILSPEDMDKIEVPNPETDGLLPFMLNRLVKARPHIEAAGHKIRFSVSRGPLNIATFLMGTTEFLMAMMTNPDETHALLRKITDFLKSWHKVQHHTFDTIDGIMMLDDIVGFISEEDFREFALPYMKELYDTKDAIKLFHNDADCSASVKYYPEIGINLYNPGIQMSLSQIREATSDNLAILGNIPPRDVLASGDLNAINTTVKDLVKEAEGFNKIIYSCGGGMPPAVNTQSLQAFLKALE